MTHTALPSIKGQVTIPTQIRKKYNISKKTPLIFEDKGNGLITIKIMRMVPDSEIEYYENEKEFGIRFKKGIDPQILIDALKKTDG